MDANPTLTPAPQETRRRRPRGVAGGAILIVIGLVSLLSRYFNLPDMIYPLGIGLIFLLVGLLTRASGLLVPGGILTGIFAGTVLVQGPFSGLADPVRSGIFLAAFASGWVLISLLSLYTEGSGRWWSWPLYPAVILGLIACALLAGQIGLQILTALGTIWPVFLIAGGIYLVVRRWPRS